MRAENFGRTPYLALPLRWVALARMERSGRWRRLALRVARQLVRETGLGVLNDGAHSLKLTGLLKLHHRLGLLEVVTMELCANERCGWPAAKNGKFLV